MADMVFCLQTLQPQARKMELRWEGTPGLVGVRDWVELDKLHYQI
jgi:hypothetical protein